MALVQYNRCEESYPEKLRSKPQDFYVKTKQKIKDLQAEMNKKGDSGQSSKLARENIAKAQELITAHRFKEAIEPLQLARQLDKGNPQIDRLMKEVRSGIEAR